MSKISRAPNYEKMTEHRTNQKAFSHILLQEVGKTTTRVDVSEFCEGQTCQNFFASYVS